MSVQGAAREKQIDPKVVAALVNRFVADSAGFLQEFGLQCEVKLLALAKRVARLERLVKLFERKVAQLDAADGVVAPQRFTKPTSAASHTSNAHEPVSASVATPVAGESSDSGGAGGDVEPPVPEPIADPVEDEKYAKYCRMHRAGVPLLAVRQRLLLDATQDPSLDVAWVDKLEGGCSGAGAGAALVPPAPKLRSPALAQSPTRALEPSAPAPADSADAGSGGTAETSAPASIDADDRPSLSVVDPTDLAAAAVAMARSRLNRTENAVTDTPTVQQDNAPAPPGKEASPPLPKKPTPPPPPPKVQSGAAQAKLSPEAAMRMRRAIVAQDSSDDAQSDLSDF